MCRTVAATAAFLFGLRHALAIASDSHEDLAVSLDLAHETKPITKVVNLLEGMAKKLEEEQEADEEAKAKWDCWCKTNDADKKAAIEAGKEKLAGLKSKIGELGPLIEQLTAQIRTANVELTADKRTLDKAYSIRVQQQNNFKEDEASMLKSISQVADAKTALSASQPDSLTEAYKKEGALLQMSPASVKSLSAGVSEALKTRGALLYSRMSRAEQQALDDFIKDPVSSAKGLSLLQDPTSGSIVGILQSMADDFAEDLKKELDDEKKNKESYAALADSMQAEIKAGEELVIAKNEKKSTAESDLAAAKKDERVTQKNLEADIKFQATVEKQCHGNDATFQDRIQARQEEMAAVSNTISVLMSDESRDLLTKSVSFLQLSTEDVAAHKAAAFLVKEGQRLGAQKLVTLGLESKLDGFTKVKAAIDVMVTDLKTQQKDEVDQRDVCIADLSKNNMSAQDKTEFKIVTEGKIGDLKALIAECAKDIKSLKEEIAEMSKQAQIAGEDKQKQNQEFQAEVEEQKQTQAILKKAVAFLQKLYGSGASSVRKSFLQVKSKEVQVKKVAADPATGHPEGFQEYEKSQAGVGVVTLIETIIEDSAKVEAKTVEDEQEAQVAYEEFMKQTGESTKAKNTELDAKMSEEATAKGDLAEEDSSLDATETELQQLFETKLSLHKECDFFLANFEVRQKARSEELDALVQAKAILGGAKGADFAGFIQRLRR
mmetsp:Transcript_55067/g.98227  ORF Transcript_55067/g.98227 Transcript_55067/m.98227 type:complete len:719 (-) Transcript_55067:66-2222(-)